MTERFALVLLLGAIPVFFAGSYPAALTYLATFDFLAFLAWAWDRDWACGGRVTAARLHAATWILHNPESIMLELSSACGRPVWVDVTESLPVALDHASLPGPRSPAVAEALLADAQDLALLALGVGLPGGADALAHPRPRLAPSRTRSEQPDWSKGELPADDTAERVRGDESEDDRDGRTAIVHRLGIPPALVPQCVTIPPHRSVVLKYALTPRVPGRLDLGPIHLRCRGPLGLASVHDSVELDSMIDVKPARPAADQRGALEGKPDAGQSGLIASRAKGAGYELESLRPYQPSDGFRKIAWKASARRGRPIVRETQAEVSQQVLLVVDAGRATGIRLEDAPSTSILSTSGATRASRMRQGEARGEVFDPRVAHRPCLLDFARGTALDLAGAALDRDDSVGLLVFDDAVSVFLKPARGRRQLAQITRALSSVEPSQMASDIDVAAEQLLTRLHRHSLVVMLTPLPTESTGRPLDSRLALLARRHALVVVSLRDPELASRCRSAAGEELGLYARASAARILADRQAVVSGLVAGGIAAIDVDPDGLSPRLLNVCLKAARRRRCR